MNELKKGKITSPEEPREGGNGEIPAEEEDRRKKTEEYVRKKMNEVKEIINSAKEMGLLEERVLKENGIDPNLLEQQIAEINNLTEDAIQLYVGAISDRRERLLSEKEKVGKKFLLQITWETILENRKELRKLVELKKTKKEETNDIGNEQIWKPVGYSGGEKFRELYPIHDEDFSDQAGLEEASEVNEAGDIPENAEGIEQAPSKEQKKFIQDFLRTTLFQKGSIRRIITDIAEEDGTIIDETKIAELINSIEGQKDDIEGRIFTSLTHKNILEVVRDPHNLNAEGLKKISELCAKKLKEIIRNKFGSYFRKEEEALVIMENSYTLEREQAIDDFVAVFQETGAEEMQKEGFSIDQFIRKIEQTLDIVYEEYIAEKIFAPEEKADVLRIVTEKIREKLGI